ncbi:GLPGLI family protein [Aquimarina sp. U1-2]|uniref:GLPGLI family protein n=1 Tax=Aquimarina sp. U1-2 TaxID=2823141 RepID=UPI001AED05C8|nr:GLPGLI family protein [Aquimarina sp. U1-2]MBP2832796.1 GLPGLI family protein [Aquimarina sp. U1-2]
MKKIVIILALIIQYIGWSQTYTINYKKFSKNVDGNLEEAVAKWKDDQKTPDHVLLYNNGISWYGAIDDTPIVKQDNKNSSDQKISTTRIVNTSAYKNHKEKLLYTNYGEIFSKFGEINPIKKEQLTSYGWKITKETQIISGYTCRQATAYKESGEKLVAWYTDQIPINDGPSRFWGLPGLIVQLQSGDKFFYVATSVKEKNENIAIAEPEGNIMNPEKFEAYMANMLKPRTITRPDGTVVRISGGKN